MQVQHCQKVQLSQGNAEYIKIFINIYILLLSLLLTGAKAFLYVATLPPEDRRFNGKFIDRDTKLITWESIRIQVVNQTEQLSFTNIRED